MPRWQMLNGTEPVRSTVGYINCPSEALYGSICSRDVPFAEGSHIFQKAADQLYDFQSSSVLCHVFLILDARPNEPWRVTYSGVGG